MLSDGETLEILRISTRLLLHYESILARETGILRPYGIEARELTNLVARADQLLQKDGRASINTYGGFGFIDHHLASRLLAEALDIISIRYSAEHLLDNAIARIIRPALET